MNDDKHGFGRTLTTRQLKRTYRGLRKIATAEYRRSRLSAKYIQADHLAFRHMVTISQRAGY